MTATLPTLEGRTEHLADGSPVALRIEADRGSITIQVTDDRGLEVARAVARRRSDHPAGELDIRTAPSIRRRGLARLVLAELVAWAQAHAVPFLVVDLPVSAGEGRAFLLHSGFPVAVRTSGDTSRFALAVPARPAAERTVDVDAFERAEAALEGGASLQEAEALFDRMVGCRQRHPATAA